MKWGQQPDGAQEQNNNINNKRTFKYKVLIKMPELFSFNS